MNDMLKTVWGVLTLKTATFERLRDDPNGIRKGVLLIAIISLFVAIPGFIDDLIQGSRPFDAAAIEREFMAGFEPAMQFWPPEVREQFKGSIDVGLRIAASIAALPTRLPRPASAVLEALGNFLSRPFGWLGAWLSYLIWVMLFAKLLGGSGGIREMMATTSLFALPGVLGFFGFVPCLGFILWLIAFAWGVVIYTKGIAVANGFDGLKAVVAVFLPAVLAVLFALGLLFTLIVFLILIA